MITKSHHFFILPSSPWPLVSSLIAFNTFLSILNMLKFGETGLFLFRVILISLTSFFWWISYRGEFSLLGRETLTLERGLKFSILLFISSEVLFFFSFFWAYFHFFLATSLELGLEWPPVGVEMFSFLNVPLINTMVLLRSGVTVTIRHLNLTLGKMGRFNLALFATAMLGVLFTFLQLIEYFSSFFSIRDRTFGTSFFVLTGFHGVHVFIGTLYLILVLYRSVKFSNIDMRCIRFEIASWYWHFVDVVWIFLYFSIYYLNRW